MSQPLEVLDLGLMGYRQALQLQDRLVDERQRGLIPDRLLLLEHPPVITYGRRAGTRHLRVAAEELQRHGVELVETDRGGDITFHGPGQLVGYLILHLEGQQQSVPWLFRAIEGAICSLLAQHRIEAEGGTPVERSAHPTLHQELGHAGVWVGSDKVCAIGLRLWRWISKHGLALNVKPNDEYFQLITACGLAGRGIVSMSQLLGRELEVDPLKPPLAAELGHALERNPVWL